MAGSYIGEVIGQNVRALREAALLTQEQAAERAGMSPSQYNLLENGKVKRPHPSTLKKLGYCFGVDPQELRSPEGTTTPKTRTPLPEQVWASSFPDEGFRQDVERASSLELVHALKTHVGNQQARELDDYRQDREGSMSAGMARVFVFSHAYIVDQALRARGYEEDPADFLPDYRKWREATGHE
jgi:transcriptional regulator with XRE-family HTH domain